MNVRVLALGVLLLGVVCHSDDVWGMKKTVPFEEFKDGGEPVKNLQNSPPLSDDKELTLGKIIYEGYKADPSCLSPYLENQSAGIDSLEFDCPAYLAICYVLQSTEEGKFLVAKTILKFIQATSPRLITDISVSNLDSFYTKHCLKDKEFSHYLLGIQKALDAERVADGNDSEGNNGSNHTPKTSFNLGLIKAQSAGGNPSKKPEFYNLSQKLNHPTGDIDDIDTCPESFSDGKENLPTKEELANDLLDEGNALTISPKLLNKIEWFLKSKEDTKSKALLNLIKNDAQSKDLKEHVWNYLTNPNL